MLRVIRLAQTDPLVWQRALLTSEVCPFMLVCYPVLGKKVASLVDHA